MKRIRIEFKYENIDDMNNEMIAEALEEELLHIEGASSITVIDIKDYHKNDVDIENFEHCNFGYEY